MAGRPHGSVSHRIGFLVMECGPCCSLVVCSTSSFIFPGFLSSMPQLDRGKRRWLLHPFARGGGRIPGPLPIADPGCASGARGSSLLAIQEIRVPRFLAARNHCYAKVVYMNANSFHFGMIYLRKLLRRGCS